MTWHFNSTTDYYTSLIIVIVTRIVRTGVRIIRIFNNEGACIHTARSDRWWCSCWLPGVMALLLELLHGFDKAGPIKLATNDVAFDRVEISICCRPPLHLVKFGGLCLLSCLWVDRLSNWACLASLANIIQGDMTFTPERQCVFDLYRKQSKYNPNKEPIFLLQQQLKVQEQ